MLQASLPSINLLADNYIINTCPGVVPPHYNNRSVPGGSGWILVWLNSLPPPGHNPLLVCFVVTSSLCINSTVLVQPNNPAAEVLTARQAPASEQGQQLTCQPFLTSLRF
jgi:hypothetical protein